MAALELRVKPIRSPAGTLATLAQVEGAIDASTLARFQEVMDKLIARGVKNLVLDCAAVRYINSSGLGTLLKYAETFESINGNLMFSRVPSKVLLVMEMLGFHTLFNIVPDEAAALKMLADKAVEAPAPQAGARPGSRILPAAAPPLGPAPPRFPVEAACARCRAVLELPGPGKYKCPRCWTVLAVEPTGRVRFFTSARALPVEVSVPCRKDLLPGLTQLARSCAASAGFSGQSLQDIAAALGEACRNVMELACGNDPSSLLHLLFHADAKALTMRIADCGKPLEFGAQGSIHSDPRFARLVKLMDTVEHRANPAGGNLLTLIKVLP